MPLRRPIIGGPDTWDGVYFGGPATRADYLSGMASSSAEELGDPQVADAFAEMARLDAESPLVEWLDGVRFHDAQSGLVVDVVPGKSSPVHWSETSVHGDGPTDAPSLSRLWLNRRALDFLRQHGRGTIVWGEVRPQWADEADSPRPGRRPDDEYLARFVADCYVTGQSPRWELSDFHGVSPNTADDWIKRARTMAPAYGIEIPAPTRGRGNKRTKEQS